VGKADQPLVVHGTLLERDRLVAAPIQELTVVSSAHRWEFAFRLENATPRGLRRRSRRGNLRP
jgi:hypothetical protein